MDSLEIVSQMYDSIVYISYFTVAPSKDSVSKYLESFSKKCLTNNKELWVLGRNTQELEGNEIINGVRVFKDMEAILKMV